MFDFPKKEEEILKFWQEKKIFEKTLEKTKKRKDFVFYDGPPFISGLPHYGQLLGSIAKDLIPRYWTMKGKKVERVFGGVQWMTAGRGIIHSEMPQQESGAMLKTAIFILMDILS